MVLAILRCLLEIRGYQYGATTALSASSNNIDLYYVDGVSITQGYPRKHVWTLMAGSFSNISYTLYNCPCNTIPAWYKYKYHIIHW